VIQNSENVMNRLYAVGLNRIGGTMGTDLALALFYTGDDEEARRIAAIANGRADQSGNPTLLAWASYLQGELDADQKPAEAIETLEESVEYAIAVGNEFVAGISLIALAATASRHGDSSIAFEALERCIHLFSRAGNRPQLWTAVRNLVEVLHSVGADRDALVLHAAAEADSEHAPEVFGPIGDRYREMVDDISLTLGEDIAVGATREGGSMEYKDAVDFALNAIARAS